VNRTLVDTLAFSIPRFDTDKHNLDHTTFGRSYLDVYDRVLGRMRDHVEAILEIGVLKGGSLRLWKAWAPHARVVGLDIDPAARAYCPSDCSLVTGSQDDTNAVAEAIEACGGSPTLVIDDGSHAVEHMMASFRLIWQCVPSEGFYVIEDTGCTYHDVDPKWPGMHINRRVRKNDRKVIDEFIRENIEEIDHQQGSVASIAVYPMQLFLEKA
jgi:cephalosporin hydroxylase